MPCSNLAGHGSTQQAVTPALGRLKQELDHKLKARLGYIVRPSKNKNKRREGRKERKEGRKEGGREGGMEEGRRITRKKRKRRKKKRKKRRRVTTGV
jgi:hypothetical protein